MRTVHGKLYSNPIRRTLIISNIDESIRTLVDLGLSGTQAKSYLGLLGIGSGSISEIANVSKVARPEHL